MVIGLVGRFKFNDGAVLILHAGGGDALSPVGVKNPHRASKKSGDAWEEAGKGRGLVVIFDYKFTVFRKVIFWLSHAD